MSLAFLADAIYDVGRKIENDKLQARQDALRQQAWAREERLTNEQRNWEKANRNDAWAREDELRKQAIEREQRLYDDRRFDALKNHLMEAGLLKADDVGNLDAFNAALNKNGDEYKRNLQELVSYQAALPRIIELTEGKAPVQAIAKMNVGDIEKARSLMDQAYQTMASVVQKKAENKEVNEEVGGKLAVMFVTKLTALDNQLKAMNDREERLNAGMLTPQEAKQVQAVAMSKLNPNATPQEKEAAIAKQAAEFITTERFLLNQRRASLVREQTAVQESSNWIRQSVQGGYARTMKGLIDQPPTETTTAQTPPALATADDARKFFGSGAPAASPAPASNVPPAPPARPAPNNTPYGPPTPREFMDEATAPVSKPIGFIDNLVFSAEDALGVGPSDARQAQWKINNMVRTAGVQRPEIGAKTLQEAAAIGQRFGIPVALQTEADLRAKQIEQEMAREDPTSIRWINLNRELQALRSR